MLSFQKTITSSSKTHNLAHSLDSTLVTSNQFSSEGIILQAYGQRHGAVYKSVIICSGVVCMVEMLSVFMWFYKNKRCVSQLSLNFSCRVGGQVSTRQWTPVKHLRGYDMVDCRRTFGVVFPILKGTQLRIQFSDSEWSFFTNRISVTRITTTKNSPNRKKMGPNY